MSSAYFDKEIELEKSKIGSTVDCSPDRLEESFENDHENINSQTQDETHDAFDETIANDSNGNGNSEIEDELSQPQKQTEILKNHIYVKKIQNETRKIVTKHGHVNSPKDPNSNYKTIEIEETSVEVVGSNTLPSNPQVEPVSSVKIDIARNIENDEIETIGSAVENENFDLMSEKCQPVVVKLQKIERITVSTLNNFQCENSNCDEDFLNFHQHHQKMHSMPVILYCKNCNDYKIVQTTNIELRQMNTICE
jgi:hypothetical protein